MHDFESNEDLRLPGSGRDGGGDPEPAPLPAPRRIRQTPHGHVPGRRADIPVAARMRSAFRGACTLRPRPVLVEARSRRLRRLHAACGRMPGSQS